VLPGVVVEAASPALIEKVRSAVTDGSGQYRIVDLRPGVYSVTFTLTGFNTVKREGIELTGTFTSTVNADLRVGSLEETITVTGETPVVDVQSVKVQQTVSKDIIAAIPSSRNATGLQALIPGMVIVRADTGTGGDSGGIGGGTGGNAGTIHGGRQESSRTKNDGLNTAYTGTSGGGGQLVNVSGSQEVVISIAGGLGESEAGGVILDVIPRDGGNTFSGSFIASGANDAMQGSNYTQDLKDQGLGAPSELQKMWDINPMGGGRIIRNRLWFYLTYREWGADNTVPGMWVNRNAGNPNAWTVDFDKSRQAFDDFRNRNGVGRLTFQATPRNKVSVHWSEQYNTAHTKGGGTATQTIEATGRSRFQPSHIQQATWSSPLTSRILLEAGYGAYEARWSSTSGGGVRVDGTHNPLMISTQEQSGEIPGLLFRLPGRDEGGFGHNLIGTREWRASLSYVSGAHNMKFGYQGGFSTPTRNRSFVGSVILVRLNNGSPNRLTQTVAYPGGLNFVSNFVPVNFYAQDQWTTGRLTLQGGLRFDNAMTSYPTMRVGGQGYDLMPREIVYPARSTPGLAWHDVTPRMGVAYDVFGTGKTAVKFNLGKYMEGYSSQGGGMFVDPNPFLRISVSTTRSWTDGNKDFKVNCDLANSAKNGECGAMTDQNFGKEVFSRTYDPDFISGWGARPYNWSLGASVQQEILPRMSVSVGYFRNWWGNWFVMDNRATGLADYTPFSIKAPLDPRLPSGGGYTISGLYNLVNEKVGPVDELVQHATNLASQTENWQGVDVTVSARLQNGIIVQGGTSTGRRLADNCAVRAVLPELGASPDGRTNSGSIAGSTFGDASSVTNSYCRVVEPYLTSIAGLASYTIPKVDVQVSGTWQSNPGPPLAANFVANNAWIAGGPQPLGRVLSGGASNVTVNLIEPGTLYGARRNVLDFRVSKILRYGRTRTQVGLDVYNLTNTDVVLTYNNGFVPGGAWLTPTTIVPARYIKVGAQVDF
jgi:hypothetical protein